MPKSKISPNRIIASFRRIKPSSPWSFRDVTRKDTNALTHSYHRYPAKFIPNIVEKLLIDHTKENELVLDPFGGCGTTLVESKRLGRRSIGFDVNPIAKFIADVKTTPIKPEILELEFAKLKKRLSKKGRRALRVHLMNDRLNYWFYKKEIGQLDFIYLEIKKIKNASVKKFFLCAFSHILKNVSRWLMKSIKPTVDLQKEIPAVCPVFLKHCRSMVKKNKIFYESLQQNKNLKKSARVSLTDSTKKFPIKKDFVDLIITSPPYVTSYEYADLHQLSLLWFGLDTRLFKDWKKMSGNVIEFRKTFIGSSYKVKQAIKSDCKIANDIIGKLQSIDPSLASDVANYFVDMNSAFTEMYRVLKPGKLACVIIGNTTMKDVNILNAEVAVEQMLRIGFKKHKFIKREVPNKMITPWRDSITGKFTGLDNPDRIRAYEYEYILIMKK